MCKMPKNRGITAPEKTKLCQISLFDFMDDTESPPKEEENEPAVLLYKGQKIWIVSCGDVSEWTVVDNWISSDERWYSVRGNNWNRVRNKDIGVSVFTDQREAEEVAESYLSTHEVIRKEDIHSIEQKAFYYIRECDSRRIVSFYAILPDGKVYIRGFMTYDHIIDCGSIEKARKYVQKEFYKQDEFQYPDDIVEADDPEAFCKFKNMYLCHEGVKWDYSVPEYYGVREEKKYED